MACNHSLQRRLLLSIIRAPTRKHLPFSEFTHVQSRSIHATGWSQSQGFSISFGPEIDELLHPEKKRKNTSSDLPSGSVRSRKTNTKTTSSNVSTLEIQETHGQNNSTPVGRELERPHIQNELTDSSHGHTDTSVSSSDQTTIELSDDAYVTISKSESTHRPLPKTSPKQSGTTSGAARRQSGGREAPTQTSKMTMSNLQPRKRSEQWQVQKDALQKKFGDDGWNPRKKLSPDAMEGIRSLHEQDPDRYSTPMLAQQFKMSPEAIRRILKSKWRPSEEGMEKRRERWARRHDRIWDQKAALGLRPARRTIREVEGPEAFEEEMKAKQALGQI